MPRPTGTQTRTFTYNGKPLQTATNPENGTVTYTYDNYNKVATKTDAKGQATVYTYDTYARLTKVQRYPTGTSGSKTPASRKITSTTRRSIPAIPTTRRGVSRKSNITADSLVPAARLATRRSPKPTATARPAKRRTRD